MTGDEWIEELDARGRIEVFGRRPSVMPLVEKGLVALSAFHGAGKMWRTATLTDDGKASLARRRMSVKRLRGRNHELRKTKCKKAGAPPQREAAGRGRLKR